MLLCTSRLNAEVAQPSVMLHHDEAEQNMTKKELTCSSTLHSTLPAPRPLRRVKPSGSMPTWKRHFHATPVDEERLSFKDDTRLGHVTKHVFVGVWCAFLES